ncbi:SDR family oxidoreductase [Marinicauda algicola]|uniref:SDR family oxidoreductase n=1 Tax=Marinicauda algicola TaxID=2029849 RepID=A0A4S2GZX5_9PROT|nr:SDR family oxidoreductase [Marinicauda algicola]TGY88766.1 SDR family oxidoreductase [Marinicauda algicola]
MSASLEGCSVVVVGGSTGIGWAIAELAVKAGARAFALSRSANAPEGAEGIVADVTDEASMETAFGRIGPIHHLAYTAWSRQGAPPLATLTSGHLQETFDAKLFGALNAIRVALPYLDPTASITLTSGQVSRKYGAGTVLKGTVNAAVDSAGKHLAKELAPRRVNVISPGVTDTSQWGEPNSAKRLETLERASNALPVKRVATPEELASAYLFVMTNPFMTGAVVDVDGGGLL